MHPLEFVARRIDALNESVGRTVAWLGLVMVLAQVIVVVLRYVFAYGSIPIQESLLYYNAILFLVGAGFTFARDGHVRVDIVYRLAGPRTKAAIDLFGVVVLLLPVCAAAAWYAWPFVRSSWRVLEGSQEPLGLHLVFVLKSLILVFLGLLALQGVAVALRSWLVLRGHLATHHPPGRWKAGNDGAAGPAGADRLP